MRTAMGRLGGTVTRVCTAAGVTRSVTKLGWIVSGSRTNQVPLKRNSHGPILEDLDSCAAARATIVIQTINQQMYTG